MMHERGKSDRPIVPEKPTPTCEQIFRLFSHAERQILTHQGKTVRTFDPGLTPLQYDLLGVRTSAYRTAQ